MDRKLIKHLLKPSAYDEPTTTVELIQTHVSLLFLTDNYVYKIKKPVDLGFLNFSSLDRRRFYCNEEVRLNRRLCPDIYLGVVEVRESATGIHFKGEGSIADYAVKMKRLPESRMLHKLLAAHSVTEQDIRALAGRVAAFHLKAERGGEIDSYGSVATIHQNWEENFQQLVAFLGETVDNTDLSLIKMWGEDYLRAYQELFQERVSGGFIRECDGDLHAENICLTDDVCIFDCIEFNARFRYSDTAADIAFLLMDFDYHGRRDLSAVFLDEYLLRSQDKGLVPLLDFYKVYRALVRGKIESLRLHDPAISAEDKVVAREKAERYFKLARGYCLLEKLTPTLILTCGLMGSGKSTLAKNVAYELDMDLVASDVVRKELASLSPEARCHSPFGSGIYTPAADAATYRELYSRARASLDRKRSIIIDASFRRRPDREMFRALARESDARFFIIKATCSEKLIRQRLDERQSREGEVSDGRWEIFSLQKEEFDPLLPEEGNHVRVDTSRPLAASVSAILKGIGLL